MPGMLGALIFHKTSNIDRWIRPPACSFILGSDGAGCLFLTLFACAPAFDDPYALVVLAEEELVVLDLQTAGWPPVQLPYLASLHCSAITCSHHVSNIPLKLWERVIASGSRQTLLFSSMVGPALAPGPSLTWAQVLLDFVISSRSGP